MAGKELQRLSWGRENGRGTGVPILKGGEVSKGEKKLTICRIHNRRRVSFPVAAEAHVIPKKSQVYDRGSKKKAKKTDLQVGK